MVGILSQCTHVSNYHVVHLKYIAGICQLYLNNAKKKEINVMHHINKLKKKGKKNHIIISADAEKSLGKIQYALLIQ